MRAAIVCLILMLGAAWCGADVTKTATEGIYKDPTAEEQKSDWKQIQAQWQIYKEAKEAGDVEKAVNYAVWNVHAAWVLNNAAFEIIRDKEYKDLSLAELQTAKGYLTRASNLLEVASGKEDDQQVCQEKVEKNTAFVDAAIAFQTTKKTKKTLKFEKEAAK